MENITSDQIIWGSIFIFFILIFVALGCAQFYLHYMRLIRGTKQSTDANAPQNKDQIITGSFVTHSDLPNTVHSNEVSLLGVYAEYYTDEKNADFAHFQTTYPHGISYMDFDDFKKMTDGVLNIKVLDERTLCLRKAPGLNWEDIEENVFTSVLVFAANSNIWRDKIKVGG